MLQTYNQLNANLIVNVNGQLLHRDLAAVSPFDSSVQNGDAVWEGLRLYNGGIFRLQQHLDRLRKSAQLLRYDGYPDDEYLIEQLRNTLAANQMFDSVHVRLTVTRGLKYTSGLDPRINVRGCTCIILPEFKPPVYDRSGIKLVTASVRRPPAGVLNQHIHSCNQLTSILAKIEANAAAADDALLLDTNGFVAETNATHLFVVKSGIVLTPTTCACPEGITRAAVLELCHAHNIPFQVRDIFPAEIHAADEVFCTGTMGEITPVNQLDNTVFNSAGRRISSRLSGLFLDLTQEESNRCQIVEGDFRPRSGS